MKASSVPRTPLLHVAVRCALGSKSSAEEEDHEGKRGFPAGRVGVGIVIPWARFAALEGFFLSMQAVPSENLLTCLEPFRRCINLAESIAPDAPRMISYPGHHRQNCKTKNGIGQNLLGRKAQL